jgi:hypothetical protein
MGLLKVDYSEVKPHLIKEEKILDSISGDLKNTVPGNEPERKGLLTATDRRLIFLVRGTEGKEVMSFPYMEITKVAEGGGYTGHPFEFVIRNKIYEMFAYRRGNVRRMIPIVKDEIERIRSEANARPVQADVYVEINKLAELRDKGVITPEDYEIKKKELLARI